MQGIQSNLVAYQPQYVTMDEACQYARAIHNSSITSSTYDSSSGQMTTVLGGETDMPTKIYFFTETDGAIKRSAVNVPAFTGTTQVAYPLHGSLDHVLVTPTNASVAVGGSQQFTAQGYDTYDNVIPNLSFTWSVAAGGGSFDAAGLFTAGIVPGTYAHTVVAATGGVQGDASVTVTPPPPSVGPGGPILVVASAANPFSHYYAEILRTEGLNAFTVTDITLVTAAVLANYDVVILGEMSLTSAQVAMFTDWVTGGGQLIAMRPDKQLAGLLGLTDASATLADAYLLVDTSSPPGAGIVNQTMQFHGTADRYTANGAASLATLYSNAAAPTNPANPALTLRSVGSNGGQAAAFTYDLARSIVYTRQGNPAWAGQERDGAAPIRPNDLFYPDWVDLNKVAIPQADEQQRLLANLIGHMNLARKPLPRFWYFPNGYKAIVVMTSDDHGASATASRFEGYKASSPQGCSVADWQCIRSTGYIYNGNSLTDAQAAAYTADGFEVGLHVDTLCSDWTPETLASFYAGQLAEFRARYPSIGAPASERTHCIAWSDWASHAKVELTYGSRLDTNYYYWPPDWVADRPGLFTGSGMPMRFADLDGAMIDVYQATTQMTDESAQTYPYTIDTLLDRALGSEGYYGVFTANMHADMVESAGSDEIVASAKARGVPVVSARQMLQWLDGRNASAFGSLAWSGSTLSFQMVAHADARNLQAMVPIVSGVGTLIDLRRDGGTVSYTTQNVKGVEYAFFPAAAGPYEAVYGVDTTPPVISSVSANPSSGTAQIAWTTDESSNSRVDYGTSPQSLNLNVQSGVRVTAHNVTLPGLAPETTYYYRVTSSDLAQNTSTWPAGGNPLTFTTLAPGVLDHFTLQSISSPQYVGVPFPVTVEARDATGNLVADYAGPAALGDTTGTISPAGTGTFAGGIWTGNVTIGQANDNVVISVSDGASTGASNSFRTAPTGTCPCSIWSASAVPGTPAVTEGQPIEVGVKFRSDVAGYITGLRFYKGSQNTGTHVGRFWTANGLQLAEVTFTNESTEGWQEVLFATPVPIAANTTYVASYYSPEGYFAFDANYFGSSGVDDPPLHALQSGVDGVNGVYKYGASGFPSSGSTSNYWVDVVFDPNATGDPTPYTISVSVVGNGSVSKDPDKATYSYGEVVQLTAMPGTGECFAGWSGDLAGSANPAWLRVDGNKTVTANFSTNCTIWSASAVPGTSAVTDGHPIEVGVKFRSDVAGSITGLRFYKGSLNTGTHVGHLWTAGGLQLAEATFTDESAEGWQEVLFATPVPIAANSTHVASYYSPSGYFAYDADYFANAGVNNPPLRALQSGVDGPNGVFNYGASGFPSGGDTSNYWVDVVFTAGNRPPTAQNLDVATAEDVALDVVLAATDVDNDPLTYVVVTSPGHGTLTGTSPNLLYTPAANYNGPDSFTYKANDGTADSNVATVSITVTAVNHAQVLTDTSVADFGASTANSCYIAETDNGEVILTPTKGTEFNGTALPEDWEGSPWGSGGSVSVSGGHLTLNYGYACTTSLYGPGRALEFVATFSNQTTYQNQHAGLGEDLNSEPWAVFSTGPGGTVLKARSSGAVDTDLGASYLGSSHLYRIEWYADHIVYYIDGEQVADQIVSIGADMRPIASDGTDPATLSIDWMRMSPPSPRHAV